MFRVNTIDTIPKEATVHLPPQISISKVKAMSQNGECHYVALGNHLTLTLKPLMR